MILHCCIHLKLGECHNTATFHNRQRAGPRLSSVQLKPALSAVTHCCDRCVYKSRCWHDVRDKMCRRKCSRRGKNKKSLFAHNRCGERSPFSWIVSPSPLRLHLCSIQWQDPKVFQEKKINNRDWNQKRKKKEKEVSCCFLQPPSSSSSFGSRAVNIPWKRRRLLLLLLRALPASPSPSSSGVHGASGSCCCADMMALAIVSKMRRFHGARARARSVTEGRVGGTRMIPVQNVPFHVRS